MDTQDDHETPQRHCPTCGAEMPANARFCGSCGSDTLPATPAEPAKAPAAERVAATPAASASPAASQANAEVSAADGQHCTWCGAYSPPDARRCVSCDAAFPTPEGDEALERAAQARIKAMEGDLQQQRQRGWWPFRSH